MSPTLNPGSSWFRDRIIVLRNLAIGPGDVVTFRDPFDPKRWGMGWGTPIDCVGFIVILRCYV